MPNPELRSETETEPEPRESRPARERDVVGRRGSDGEVLHTNERRPLPHLIEKPADVDVDTQY